MSPRTPRSPRLLVAILVFLLILGIWWFATFKVSVTPQPQTIITTSEILSEDVAYQPTREPYGDCSWEQLTGAGITLFGQRCVANGRTLSLAISETLPGVFLEEETSSGRVALDELIRIFEIPAGDITAILPLLAQSETWDPAEGCTFTKDETTSTPEITRYTLAPTGQALLDFQALAPLEPITSTCNEYGMGNSGIRYFEVHASNPTKALFLEIGQEAPLFDEYSIRVF